MAVDAYTPDEACSKILNEIQDSNLHFLVQATPFSMYITIRKKFTKNVPESPVSRPISNPGLKESDTNAGYSELRAELAYKDGEVTKANDTIRLLEEKLATCESDLLNESKTFKAKKDKLSDEIKLLQESIKKSNVEKTEKTKALIEANKIVKSKDKENYNHTKRIENFLETTKNLKETITELKKDKTKLEKAAKAKKIKPNVDIKNLKKK